MQDWQGLVYRVNRKRVGERHRGILLSNSVSHPNNVPEPSNLRALFVSGFCSFCDSCGGIFEAFSGELT